jgi:hypothetical protein
MISIGPKELVGDEFRCDFNNVARLGDVVAWHGSCELASEKANAATVVARLAGKALYLDNAGEKSGPYRRCTSTP